MSLLSNKELLGIDIGTRMIRVLELKSVPGKISVLNYAECDVGSLGLADKSPDEKIQAYVDALKKLSRSCKFSTKNVALSVSGSSVVVRFVKFPKMSAAELDKTLPFEAEPHIPFDIQEVNMDTQVIADIEDEEQKKMETVLVASKKNTIQEKILIVERAGFSPAVIDVDAFAISNAYEYVNKKQEGLIMLVNIGASITNICIVENGISKVVRDLYTAGNSFTGAIQNKMGNTTAEAEKIKVKYGLVGGQQDEVSDENNIGLQIYDILHPIVKELNSEIQRSIDYFMGQQTVSDLSIKKIILTGGSSALKGLPEMISSDLGIPVEIFKPLMNADKSHLKSEAALDSPAITVATGLAVRKIGDHRKK
jgi:type IV pilus assembly protein PilM